MRVKVGQVYRTVTGNLYEVVAKLEGDDVIVLSSLTRQHQVTTGWWLNERCILVPGKRTSLAELLSPLLV